MPLQTEERAPDPLELHEVVFLFDPGPGYFQPIITLVADSEGHVCLDKDKASMVGSLFMAAAKGGWNLRVLTERGTR